MFARPLVVAAAALWAARALRRRRRRPRNFLRRPNSTPVDSRNAEAGQDTAADSLENADPERDQLNGQDPLPQLQYPAANSPQVGLLLQEDQAPPQLADSLEGYLEAASASRPEPEPELQQAAMIPHQADDSAAEAAALFTHLPQLISPHQLNGTAVDSPTADIAIPFAELTGLIFQPLPLATIVLDADAEGDQVVPQHHSTAAVSSSLPKLADTTTQQSLASGRAAEGDSAPPQLPATAADESALLPGSPAEDHVAAEGDMEDNLTSSAEGLGIAQAPNIPANPMEPAPTRTSHQHAAVSTGDEGDSAPPHASTAVEGDSAPPHASTIWAPPPATFSHPPGVVVQVPSASSQPVSQQRVVDAQQSSVITADSEQHIWMLPELQLAIQPHLQHPAARSAIPGGAAADVVMAKVDTNLQGTFNGQAHGSSLVPYEPAAAPITQPAAPTADSAPAAVPPAVPVAAAFEGLLDEAAFDDVIATAAAEVELEHEVAEPQVQHHSSTDHFGGARARALNQQAVQDTMALLYSKALAVVNNMAYTNNGQAVVHCPISLALGVADEVRAQLLEAAYGSAISPRTRAVQARISGLEGDVTRLRGDVARLEGDTGILQGDNVRLQTEVNQGQQLVMQQQVLAQELRGHLNDAYAKLLLAQGQCLDAAACNEWLVNHQHAFDDGIPHLHAGQLEAVRLLGAGSCGAVVLAQAPQAEGPPVLVAVKTLMGSLGGGVTQEVAYQSLQQEILAMKKIKPSRNIVAMLGLVHTHTRPEPCGVAVEYLPGGDFETVIQEHLACGVSVPQDLVWAMFQQILGALCDLHGCEMMHLDLKPQNILLSEKVVVGQPTPEDLAFKLSDLGSARRSYGHLRVLDRNCIFTPAFSPTDQANGLLSQSCDIWALGVTAYQALSGGALHQGQHNHEIFRLAQQGDPSHRPTDEQLEQYGEAWGYLLKLCLDLNAFKRPTALSLMFDVKFLRSPQGRPVFELSGGGGTYIDGDEHPELIPSYLLPAVPAPGTAIAAM